MNALNNLRVQPDSPVPLHAQVEQLLRDLIRRPEYQRGGLLPDEVSLANRLGISRGTVRAAIGRLVQEGILERRAGVGTRLATRPVESAIGAWRSFSLEMATKGITVQNYLERYEEAELNETAAGALRLQAGASVWRLDRCRGWNDLPVLHSRSWFHPRLGLTGRERFDRPLYAVLEQSVGAVVRNAHEEFKAVSPTPEMAAELKIESSEPLLLRCHTVFDGGGRPIEFAEVYYVSSRFALTIELRRDPG